MSARAENFGVEAICRNDDADGTWFEVWTTTGKLVVVGDVNARHEVVVYASDEDFANVERRYEGDDARAAFEDTKKLYEQIVAEGERGDGRTFVIGPHPRSPR